MNPPPPLPPPDCGRRILASLIDERAKAGHERPIVAIPTLSTSYRDVSYSEFAHAINRFSQWLLQTLGRPVQGSFPTIAYLGPNDLRYQILMIAASKTGYSLFLPSTRNSRDAFLSLFNECKVTVLLTNNSRSPSVSIVTDCLPSMRKEIVPELDDLLGGDPVEPIVFPKTWSESRMDPFLHIHTSGSTGLPKVVTLRHGSFSAYDAMQTLEPNELAQRYGNMRVLCSLPPFHLAGIMYSLAMPCFFDSTVILPPAGPLSADIINDAHTHAGVEHSQISPSLLIDLSKNAEYLENLSRLRRVTFGGGPLPESVGQLIAQRTELSASMGTTEVFAIPQLPKDREDWPYFKFDPVGGNIELRERSEGLFEMVLVRKPELDLAQPVFINFPHLQEFCTKDLYEKHPTKPDLWKYKSRLDDIIVLNNGEKLNPVTIEGLVSSCPAVKGCLIIGQGKFQVGALVEPTNPASERAALLDEVWPYLQKANGQSVKHGRVIKELVIFTHPDKPLPRAGKGTIQRAASNKLYASEIEEAYQRLDDDAQIDAVEIDINLNSLEETRMSLSSFLSKQLEIEGVSDLDEDFFMLGMDSLQLLSLVRAINGARPGRPVDAKWVYDHPSIEKLAEGLHEKPIFQHEFCPYDSDDEDVQADWLALNDMYKDITQGWERKGWPCDPKESDKSRRITLQSSNDGPIIQPDGGPEAWLQVLASFLININNWGLINTFGVFQSYYEGALTGYSPSSIAWIGTLQGALILIVGVFSGPLFDTGYFGCIVVVATIVLTFALCMLSLSTTYWEVMLTQGVLTGISSGFLFVPSIALIPFYFKHNRGLALALATSGGSIGGIIYPIVFRRVLTMLSFGWTVRVIALLALTTLTTATIIMKPLGPRTRRQLFHPDALRDSSYLFFMFSIFFTFAALIVPFVLCTSFAASVLRTNLDTAFYLLPCLNAAQFFGRLIFGHSSDYHQRITGPEVFLIFSMLAAGLLGFCWIAVDSLGGYVPWLIVYGLLSGGATTLPAIVLPHICPNLAVYGTRLGMLYAAGGVGVLISVPVATAANARSGGFTGAQAWIGACFVAAAAFFAVTAVRARKRRLLYERGKMGWRTWRKRRQHLKSRR